MVEDILTLKMVEIAYEKNYGILSWIGRSDLSFKSNRWIPELIPDNIPIIGNLDEVAAGALLLMSLRYFGYDLPNIFIPKSRNS